MSGNARHPLASVAVVGGGPVALAAATGLAQALPAARVTLVPAPVAPAAFADRLPLALPSSFATLARLGCPADALLTRGVAQPRLATRFRDWRADGASFLVGDDLAPPGPGVPLHHLWLRSGTDLPFHALLPACVAAETGGALPVETALHLEPSRIVQVLASLARQHGVTAGAALATVEHDDAGIATLHREDGTRVAADLYVDASGPDRRLSATAPLLDWRTALPCERLHLTMSADPWARIDDYRATDTGWTAHWPGVTANTGEAPDAVVIAPGRLVEAWRGNVVALGEACAQPGPLGLAGLTLALGQLALLLELLPAQGDEPLLRAEYNRRAALRADRMRDHLAAHYWGGRRRDGAFWRRLSADQRPPDIAAVLAQFERRGHLPHADEESVARDAWIALLLGQGIRPERAHPVALGIAPARAAAIVTELAAHLRTAARDNCR